MEFDITFVLILLVIVLSTLIRAVFGFGNALVAMPLLTMLLGIQTASPLVALTGPLISILILLKDWKSIEIKSTLWLITASLIGIPIGLYILKGFQEALVKDILAWILILFGVYSLFNYRIPLLGEIWAIPFGLLAGILGGAYNSNGPPIVIFGALRKWNPQRFRSSLQGYFLVTGLMIVVGHGLAGLWTTEVLWLFLFSVPVIVLSILLGNRLNQRIPAGKFDRMIHILLIGLGILLLVD